jgi:hypothetical protein
LVLRAAMWLTGYTSKKELDTALAIATALGIKFQIQVWNGCK